MANLRRYLVLIASLLLPSIALGEDPEHVKALKPILEQMKKEGTKERVTDFFGPDSWVKRRYVATNVKHVIRKTESKESPFTVEITFDGAIYVTGIYATKEGAERAELPKKPITSRPGSIPWKARFAWQDGKWVIQDVGVINSSKGSEKWHSKLEKESDPINDWWWALGGK